MGSETGESVAARDGEQVVGWDAPSADPEWADGGVPDARLYVESELFVAGAISTQPPFSSHHPAWALPTARVALDALSKWEPTDG